MTALLESTMNVRDSAAFLNIGEKKMYGSTQREDRQRFKAFGSWRFQRPDLEAWIAQRKDQAAAKQK